MNTIFSTNSIRKLVSVALVGAFCASFAALPAAAQDSDGPKVSVKSSDLNLSSARDAAALLGRIRTAAEEICSPYARSDFAASMHARACVDKTVADTVASVSKPGLTEAYQGSLHKRPSVALASL
jgi:UrcA family protein